MSHKYCSAENASIFGYDTSMAGDLNDEAASLTEDCTVCTCIYRLYTVCTSTIVDFSVHVESEACTTRLIVFGKDRLSETKGDAVAHCH